MNNFVRLSENHKDDIAFLKMLIEENRIIFKALVYDNEITVLTSIVRDFEKHDKESVIVTRGYPFYGHRFSDTNFVYIDFKEGPEITSSVLDIALNL